MLLHTLTRDFLKKYDSNGNLISSFQSNQNTENEVCEKIEIDNNNNTIYCLWRDGSGSSLFGKMHLIKMDASNFNIFVEKNYFKFI